MRNLLAAVPAMVMALPLLAQDLDKYFTEGLEAARRGDYAAAVREWRPLAEQGHADAQYNLGQMYRHGQGVERDHVQAFMWLQLAALSGAGQAADSRDALAKLMRPADVVRAQRLAAKWEAKLPPVRLARNRVPAPPCTEVNTDALKLAEADLRGGNLNGSDFSGACLRGVKMDAETTLLNTTLAGADLSGASLAGAKFLLADLSGANLIGADLTDAILNGAILKGTDLCAADLTGVDLTTAVLDESIKLSFRHANLRNTTLPRQLAGADLTGANIKGLKFAGPSKEQALDLSKAILVNIVSRDSFATDASLCLNYQKASN